MATTGYENFDLKPPRTGPDPVMITLSVALGLVLVGLAFLGFANQRAKSDALQMQQQIASLTQQLEAKESDMAALIADQEAEKKRIEKEWTERFETAQAANQAQLEKTYSTISAIVNESGGTMQQMKLLEQKVKDGKQLQQQEIAQMKALANGLAYLHKQYEKPISEFRELDEYLTAQMQMDRVPPAERGALLKRIFSKEYRDDHREQVAAYYKDQGRLDALEDTQVRVSAAYQNAQSAMGQIRLNTDKYLQDLNRIVDTKEANVDAVDSFFEVSQKILQVHQNMMNLEVPVQVEEPNPPRP